MTDDFRDDDLPDAPWADGTTAPPVSADFVDRTAAAVRADRARIATEAARVDSDPLPHDLLAAHVPPPPSADFVARTAARIAADRRARDDADRRALELLETYGVPPATPEFVDRTLAALRVERSPLRLVDGATPATATPAAPRRRAGRRRRLPPLIVAAAAAAAVLVGLLRPDALRSEQAPPLTVAGESAQRWSPAPLATTWQRRLQPEAETLRFEAGDGLLLLAAAEGRG